MTEKLLEATPEEHAYHIGWQTYHNGVSVAVNPYDTDDEIILYEEFERGWANAQLGDND